MALKESSDTAWLGLDLGTQSARAMVVSGTGETLAVGSHKLTSRRDGPRHEQDPEQWWHAISAACQAAFAALPARFIVPGVLGVAEIALAVEPTRRLNCRDSSSAPD